MRRENCSRSHGSRSRKGRSAVLSTRPLTFNEGTRGSEFSHPWNLVVLREDETRSACVVSG